MTDEEDALRSFITATGGGTGKYKSKINEKRNDSKIFDQHTYCIGEKCGFGRLAFPMADNDYKLYLRIPQKADPMMVLYFMNTVWNLPSPKLLIGITGGALDFKISPELESVLNEIMHITRETEAWIITGGTRGGIMKRFGKFLIETAFQFSSSQMFSHYYGRASTLSIRRKYSLDRHHYVG
jgi:hypothetical protein